MIKVTNLQEMNRIENGSLQMHIQEKAEAMMQEYQVENLDTSAVLSYWNRKNLQTFQLVKWSL